MASGPDHSGAKQVQFEPEDMNIDGTDILAAQKTASAVRSEASDGSTALIPSAQSPAGSSSLSPIAEHGA